MRIVFLARVVPIKNLDFALKVLASIRARVIFDIYGPLEDGDYWKECEALMNDLPDTVEVTYRGTIEPRAVNETLAAYDLFFLPSGGENFGHVMAEALQAGLPLLISDRTPWQNLRQFGVGASLPLDDRQPFVEMIEHYAGMTDAEWSETGDAVRHYAAELQSRTRGEIDQSRKLFGLPGRDPALSV